MSIMRKNLHRRIGLKGVVLIGLSLELAHWVLQLHYPELSPHYRLHRHLWARLLMAVEYICLMAVVLIAISYIWDAISRKNLRDADVGGLILCLFLWVAFLWVYR
jgi:hypothetical protein